MITDVRPRFVAPPWSPEHVARKRRATAVHREAHVTPEAGPLAEYLRLFPNRYVVWNVPRQLFEVRERNEQSGKDERVTFVFEWQPDPESGERVRVFRAFDYAYVAERREDLFLLEHEGEDALHRKTQEHNRKVARQKVKDAARESAAGFIELRRYLPVLAALHAGATPAVAMTERVPLVSPGITLKGS